MRSSFWYSILIVPQKQSISCLITQESWHKYIKFTKSLYWFPPLSITKQSLRRICYTDRRNKTFIECRPIYNNKNNIIIAFSNNNTQQNPTMQRKAFSYPAINWISYNNAQISFQPNNMCTVVSGQQQPLYMYIHLLVFIYSHIN